MHGTIIATSREFKVHCSKALNVNQIIYLALNVKILIFFFFFIFFINIQIFFVILKNFFISFKKKKI